MIAALIILAVLNPVSALIVLGLCLWAARAGVLRKPATPRKPPEARP